jgi:hypothetical protein
MRHKCFLLFSGCVVAVLLLHSAIANRRTMSPDINVQQVVNALESCPAWSDANAKTNEILASLKLLSNGDTAILRMGIDKYVTMCLAEKRYDIGNMSKLFVLNRLLFAVPASEKFSGPFFGGWEGVPQDGREMNLMWPISLGQDGELRLTGKFAGYSGSRYFAVQEFDHFNVKYGRRQMRTKSALKSN